MVTLKTAVAHYPHVRALKDGTVGSDLVRFDFEDVPVITRAFRRIVRTLISSVAPGTGCEPME